MTALATRPARTRVPFYRDDWAMHDANGRPLIYPGPDDSTAYFHGHPVGWLEVHSHYDLRTGQKVQHSHADPFAEHPDHGCASFVTCSGCWTGSTGLKGGGRKRLTRGPTGVQL